MNLYLAFYLIIQFLMMSAIVLERIEMDSIDFFSTATR